jgi:hypothetical protein
VDNKEQAAGDRAAKSIMTEEDMRKELLFCGEYLYRNATKNLEAAAFLFMMMYSSERPKEVAFWTNRLAALAALLDEIFADRATIFAGESIPASDPDAMDWLVDNLGDLAKRPGIDPRVVLANGINDERVLLYPALLGDQKEEPQPEKVGVRVQHHARLN